MLAGKWVVHRWKAEAFRETLMQALTEDPRLRSVELLHRARQAGHAVGKGAVLLPWRRRCAFGT